MGVFFHDNTSPSENFIFFFIIADHHNPHLGKDDGDKNYPDDFRSPFRNGFYVAGKDLSAYLMDEIRLPDERWVLAPSLKLTFNYKEDSLLYVSVARALRMPQSPEYYWHHNPDAGVLTSGLPFHEENGLPVQAGWRATLPDQTRLEVSPYYYNISHFIQLDLINFISYNIDDARIYGIEFEVAHPFGRSWSAFLNCTFQKSRTEGDKLLDLFLNSADSDFRQVPGLPEHKFNAGVRYRASNDASVAAFAQFVSEQNVIYNNNTIGGPLTVRRQGSSTCGWMSRRVTRCSRRSRSTCSSGISSPSITRRGSGSRPRGEISAWPCGCEFRWPAA